MSETRIVNANKIRKGDEIDLDDALFTYECLSTNNDTAMYEALERYEIVEGDFAQVVGVSFRKNGRTRLRVFYKEEGVEEGIEFNLTFIDEIELLVKN